MFRLRDVGFLVIPIAGSFGAAMARGVSIRVESARGRSNHPESYSEVRCHMTADAHYWGLLQARLAGAQGRAPRAERIQGDSPRWDTLPAHAISRLFATSVPPQSRAETAPGHPSPARHRISTERF